MVISELDRLSGDFTRARGISQVRRNEIGFSSRRPNLRNCFFPAFGVATDNDDINAELREAFAASTRNRFIHPLINLGTASQILFNDSDELRATCRLLKNPVPVNVTAIPCWFSCD